MAMASVDPSDVALDQLRAGVGQEPESACRQQDGHGAQQQDDQRATRQGGYRGAGGLPLGTTQHACSKAGRGDLRALRGIGGCGQRSELAYAAVIGPGMDRSAARFQPGLIRVHRSCFHDLGEPFTLVHTGVLRLSKNPVDVTRNRRRKREQHYGGNAQRDHGPDQIADVADASKSQHLRTPSISLQWVYLPCACGRQGILASMTSFLGDVAPICVDAQRSCGRRPWRSSGNVIADPDRRRPRSPSHANAPALTSFTFVALESGMPA